MIADRLDQVRARIEAALRASGRPPGAVRLIAVSKNHPASAVREAYQAGQRDFGENYAQELVAKARELADLTDLRWHFIGHLQSNKAKVVVPFVCMVHTVDSISLARELAKRATPGSKLSVLVEVNVAGEPQKHGVSTSQLREMLDCIRSEPALQLSGLMTIPPAAPDEARAAFVALAELSRTVGAPSELSELSMGMSDDLELAIAAGSTMVRVGTAIFGSR